MSIKILTKLNPKSSRFDGVGHSTSGDDLTTQDVSAAMSGANPVGVAVLVAKICGDRSVMPELLCRIYRIVLSIAAEAGWKPPRGSERLRSMAQLAVFECCHDQACPACKGTGYRKDNPTRMCGRCGGVGRYTISETDKAKVMNISRKNWYGTWMVRYMEIKRVIENQEHSAVRQIYNKLSGGVD